MIQPTMSLQDIPRLYTAIAEWAACVLFLISTKQERERRLIIMSAAFLVVQSAFLVMTDDCEGLLWLVCMLAAVANMVHLIKNAVHCSSHAALFFGAEALILAELFASLQWMISSYCMMNGVGRIPADIAAFTLVYSGIGLSMTYLSKYAFPKGKIIKPEPRECYMAVLIASIVFFLSNLSFLMANTPLSGTNFSAFQLRALMDLGGLAILYAYHIQLENYHMMEDMVKMEAIVNAQYQQYEQSKELQDNINFKYHDLKQYITVMRENIGGGHQEQILDKIEAEIRDYEVQNKTGNPTLDTLLTSKSLTCQTNGIQLTTVANGALISFMEIADICSIFGNALDNAIEYEKTIPDPNKRMINLTVVDRNNAFLVIRCENYYEGYAGMTLENQLPRGSRTLLPTTKKDTSLHGYGLRSIQHSVHKYGGEMDLEVKDHWFRLKILIPLG